MSENNIINLPILPELITPSPTEAVLPKEAEVVKINIDDILPNSVIIIKIDQPETAYIGAVLCLAQLGLNTLGNCV